MRGPDTLLNEDPWTTGDNGSMTFWDYATGTPFQNMEDIPQPGSLEAEAGIFCSTFDMTGTRLITGGADKTIKVWVKVVSDDDAC
jgi:pleiotropic regulator 1